MTIFLIHLPVMQTSNRKTKLTYIGNPKKSIVIIYNEDKNTLLCRVINDCPKMLQSDPISYLSGQTTLPQFHSVAVIFLYRPNTAPLFCAIYERSDICSNVIKRSMSLEMKFAVANGREDEISRENLKRALVQWAKHEFIL